MVPLRCNRSLTYTAGFAEPVNEHLCMRVLLLLLSLLLSSCGQMGPLYLPEDPAPALAEPEPPPEDDEIESEDDEFDAGPD